MDRQNLIPGTTIQRLPAYLRCLLQAQARQMPLVNSGSIAEMCGTNAAQVRKDFSYLGELGTRGIGYDVSELIGHISRVLGISERRRAAIVGFGKLGGALLGYSGFGERGFEIVAVFDNDPAKVGTPAGGLTVQSMADVEPVLREQGVEIVIIATPAAATQTAADKVVAAGIKAILNLAPVLLNVPDDVSVRQVCLSTDLQILSFHLAQGGMSES
ncbi:MAG: redox-sensing transcriptional repressor Rex [Actinobacteria bacterium HGW-Actinobacteria-1]|jgi:redox-sensing transcriptional repressor|nr:MAG: redox-sensing transcriptional repressor Rex [Actinobacteria bacterium HGW-Actinobacteria-1]